MRASSFASFSFKNPSLKNNPSIVYHFRALESKLRSSNLKKGNGRNDNRNAVAQQNLYTAWLCCLRLYNASWPYEARHVRSGWSMPSCHDAHFLLCARPESAHFHRTFSSFRIRENRRRAFLDRGHRQQRAVPRFFNCHVYLSKSCTYRRRIHRELWT